MNGAEVKTTTEDISVLGSRIINSIRRQAPMSCRDIIDIAKWLKYVGVRESLMPVVKKLYDGKIRPTEFISYVNTLDAPTKYTGNRGGSRSLRKEEIGKIMEVLHKKPETLYRLILL